MIQSMLRNTHVFYLIHVMFLDVSRVPPVTAPLLLRKYDVGTNRYESTHAWPYSP